MLNLVLTFHYLSPPEASSRGERSAWLGGEVAFDSAFRFQLTAVS